MIPDAIDDMWNVGVHSKIVRVGTPCDTYPCWNNGFCLPNNTTQIGYECLCNEFYNGTHCQNRIDGTIVKSCEDSLNSVECVWKSILDKLNITTSSIQHCSTNICYNGGICVTSEGSHSQCLCPIDFGGNLCTEKTSLDLDITSLKIFCYLIALFVFLKIILFFCYSANFGCCFTVSSNEYKYSRWYLPEDFTNSYEEQEPSDIFEISNSRIGVMTFDDELTVIRLKNMGFIPEFDKDELIPKCEKSDVKKGTDEGLKNYNNRQIKEYYEMTMKSSITTDTFLDSDTVNEEETDLDFEIEKIRV